MQTEDLSQQQGQAEEVERPYSRGECQRMAERMRAELLAEGRTMRTDPQAWGWPPHSDASPEVNAAWAAFWAGTGPHPRQPKRSGDG
jgi:hypothetical protein